MLDVFRATVRERGIEREKNVQLVELMDMHVHKTLYSVPILLLV